VLDRYSFEQIGLMARCILRSRADMLNAVVGPVVGTVAGGEWRGHSVEGGKPKRPRPTRPGERVTRQGDHDDPASKERALVAGLARAGVRIRAVPSSTTTDASGNAG
jgi:hypothetical protein